MSTIERLRLAIRVAQEAAHVLDDAIEDDCAFEELRPILDDIIEHASLARLFSLYLGEASMDPAAVELRDLFREANSESLTDGLLEPRFGMGVYRVGDERFDIEAISNALSKLDALLDREADAVVEKQVQ